MPEKTFLKITDGTAVPLNELPLLSFDKLQSCLIDAVRNRHFAVDAFFVYNRHFYVILHDGKGGIYTASAMQYGHSFASLTPDAPAFHWFEREIYEQSGIKPEGHPWLKPIRFTGGTPDTAAVTDYFAMKGSAAHEVAVGPVHAGVIEPGHFRFQCMGEDVYSLEISLGYQHRGIEKMLCGGPDNRTLSVMETAAGDTSTASAGAYCRLMEGLCGLSVPERAEAIRAVAWELERIANHIGDLGALAGDVAYLPTASYCGRIRGDFLNMTALICGNRFGRNLLIPGGVNYDIEPERAGEILKRMDAAERDLNNALHLLFESPTVLDRFENTGTVSRETAQEIGLTGTAARASGIPCDVRTTHPYGYYRKAHPVMAQETAGDVAARAEIRRKELAESLKFVRQILQELAKDGSGEICSKTEKCRPLPEMLCVTLSEAWRGTLCHAAITDRNGCFARYKIVDPSFHNWFGLAMALRGEQISNFPICNKSFNLSYCGHDL